VQDSLRTLFDRALDDEPPPRGELAQEAMASGRRLRGRRRLLAGGGAAGVTAVLVAVIAVSAARTPAPEPAEAVAMAMRPACADTARKLVDAAIFLRADVTDQQRADLTGWLKFDPRISAVRYESRQAAYEKFKRMYRDAPDLVAAVKPEQLPDAFRVKLDRPSQYGRFVEEFQGRPGVESAAVGVCTEEAE
jgi:cell division transport system permease protein